MNARRLLATLATCLAAAATQGSVAPSPPLASPDLAFLESEGLVAVEAEHYLKQELTEKRAWHLTTPTRHPEVAPDIDGTHVIGASGGAYLEVLPDTRWTHDEELVIGENYSPEPGRMAVLSYRVRFTTPGRYYFWARVYSTGGEDNGLHVGLNGQWPASGQRWQTLRKRRWHWDNRQRTRAVPAGVPGQLYLDVPAAGDHLVQISMREDGCELDKWLLTKDPNYVPEGLGPPPRAASGRLPPAFAVAADYRESAPLTLRPRPASPTDKPAGTRPNQ